MADTTTELEVLNQIVDVLGGESGQYETVVPTLQQILALLGGGGGGGGYNPALSVGRADALTGADETAQWATRESTGSGSATVRSVQGASVVFNQLCDSISSNGNVQFNDSAVTVQNHVYLFIADVTMIEGATSAGVDIYGRQVGGSVQLLARASTTGTRASIIFTMSIGGLVGGSNHDEGHFWGYTLNTTQSADNGMLFDLTQMFGSGNEPTTVAEFERMYPASYYPYSAPILKPVQIAGISSTDAQGGELDSIEWTAQTLRAAGSVRDELTAGELVTRVGVTTVTGASDWRAGSTAYNGDLATDRYVTIPEAQSAASYPPHPTAVRVTDFATTVAAYGGIWSTPDSHVNECCMNSTQLHICFSNALVGITTDMTAAQRTEAIKTWLNAHPQEVWFELATPTTTPISPTLPMTYKVQAGGIESIIVPDGEVSAAPLITLAEGESASELVMDALACIAAPDGPVATANHSVGTYLTMGGKLYKVTSAIAVGETIKSGTNVTETTVMAELIARTA